MNGGIRNDHLLGRRRQGPFLEYFNSGKKSFDSIRYANQFFSIRFDSAIWKICRLYTDIKIVS